MTGTMTELDSITVVQNMRAMSDILWQNDHPLYLQSLLSVMLLKTCCECGVTY
jgi:hypothetical protein